MSHVPEEYIKLYENNKKEMIELSETNSDNEWVLLQNKEGVQAHLRKYKDHQVQLLRIKTTFNSTLQETADLLFSNSQELLNSKSQLKSAEIIEELNEQGRVVLVTTKSVLFVSARDILVYTNYENYKNGLIQVQVGLEDHPNAPIQQNIVRSTTVLGGHILLPNSEDQNKTDVEYYILNLLNGQIPAAFQNAVNIQHINGYIYFKKYFEKNEQKQQKADNSSKTE